MTIYEVSLIGLIFTNAYCLWRIGQIWNEIAEIYRILRKQQK